MTGGLVKSGAAEGSSQRRLRQRQTMTRYLRLPFFMGGRAEASAEASRTASSHGWKEQLGYLKLGVDAEKLLEQHLTANEIANVQNVADLKAQFRATLREVDSLLADANDVGSVTQAVETSLNSSDEFCSKNFEKRPLAVKHCEDTFKGLCSTPSPKQAAIKRKSKRPFRMRSRRLSDCAPRTRCVDRKSCLPCRWSSTS